MSGGKAGLHESATLNVMRGVDLTAFTPYVALYTAGPTDTTEGTEVVDGGEGYAPLPVSFGAPAGAGPSSMSNDAELVINVPPVEVVAVALKDALAGAVRYFTAIPPVQFGAGDQARFAIGSLIVQEE